MRFSLLFVTALTVFLSLDMIWLGFIAKNIYREQLGYLLSPQVNWIAAIAFYILFILGLVVFVIQPGVESQSQWTILWKGAFFGLVTYATYDLTNLATVKDWPLFITAIDLLWGSFLAASVSWVTFFLASKSFFSRS